MAGLYIGSSLSGAGKSMLSFSLGILLQQRGFSVGYMKPLGRYLQQFEEKNGDADAMMVQETLGQQAAADMLTPVMVPTTLHSLTRLDMPSVSSAARGKAVPSLPQATPMERIKAAYSQISAGRDLTIVSGSGEFPSTGTYCGADGLTLTRELALAVVLVERFQGSFEYDTLLSLKHSLGGQLLGVVLNDVPERQMRDCINLYIPFLETRGIRVLGTIPHEPGLEAIRVSDLAHTLSGYIAAGNAQASRQVEGYVVASMQVDNFMSFLRHQKKEAVAIVEGDRADMQIAALHGGSPCLVLAGNYSPCDLVRSLAEKKGIPIICVRENSFAVVKAMEQLLHSKKTCNLRQIRLATELVKTNLELQPILEIL